MSKWYLLFNISIIYVIIIIITYYIEKCILLYNRNILYFWQSFFKFKSFYFDRLLWRPLSFSRDKW